MAQRVSHRELPPSQLVMQPEFGQVENLGVVVMPLFQIEEGTPNGEGSEKLGVTR
jgi:hypothetical protein